MPHRVRKNEPRTPATTVGHSPSVTMAGVVRNLVLLAFVALLAATPLIPSEGVAEDGTGVVLIMAWLVLLTVWATLALVCRQESIRGGWIDAVVAIFLAFVCLSALVNVDRGYARATINMLWQWLSFGVCWFLARQLLRSHATVRAVCAVMIGLAVCLSAFGLYQYFWSMPELRRQYAENPEATLRDAGISTEPHAPERSLFQNRLNSTEPIATFALTNSLAGFLAPWMILTLGIAATRMAPGGPRLRTVLGAIAICVSVGLCLLLTKSRTAFLAATCGVVLLAFWRFWGRRRIDWRIAVGTVGGVATLVAGAALAGAFDRKVLTETPKSVLYRLEYWQATLAMIADHAWFGCGPGNFQQRYTAYKLPQASETIADPHNMLFEIWATAGTPAALAFLALVGLVAWRLMRVAWGRHLPTEHGADVPRSPNQRGCGVPCSPAAGDAAQNWFPVYVGGVVGVFLAAMAGPVVGFPLDNAVLWLGLPTAIAGVWVLHGWCQRGCIAVWLLVIALVVLSMNLMAAGGISFAGVAQTWWLLLALTLNVFDATASPRHDAAGANPPIPDSEHRTPRLVLAGICFLSAGLAVACFRTMYNPVLLCQARLYEGREWESGNRPERAEAAYHAAAEADPHSVEPWTALATLYCGVLMRGGDSERSAQFENAIEQVLNRKGTSHSIQRQVGDWRLALFSAGRDPEQLRRAIRAYQDGVALYPNDNMGHAQLAWASYLAGNETAAEHEATEALRLDALTPHVERRLNQQTIYDPTGNGLTRQNGELVMRRLRR